MDAWASCLLMATLDGRPTRPQRDLISISRRPPPQVCVVDFLHQAHLPHIEAVEDRDLAEKRFHRLLPALLVPLDPSIHLGVPALYKKRSWQEIKQNRNATMVHRQYLERCLQAGRF